MDKHAGFAQFTSGEGTINLFVGTYNVNAKKPGDLTQFLKSENLCDVYAIGLQEVVNLSNPINVVGPDHASRLWENKIMKYLGKSQYALLCTKQLVGVLLIVVVKRSLFPFISSVSFDTCSCGFLGVGGNKGAAAIRFFLFDTSLCFITSHLAAGMEKCDARNKNFKTICEGLTLHGYQNKFDVTELSKGLKEAEVATGIRRRGKRDLPPDHRLMFWMGDLNYRLNYPDPDYLACVAKAKSKQFKSLLQYDQLLAEIKAGRVFQGFMEGPISFPPTYKYQPKTDSYDCRPDKKKRFPAWCDRVLWLRPRDPNDIKQVFYRSCNLPRGSDHKPVSSLFHVNIKASPARPLYIAWYGTAFWDLVDTVMFIVMLVSVGVMLPAEYYRFTEVLSYACGPRGVLIVAKRVSVQLGNVTISGAIPHKIRAAVGIPITPQMASAANRTAGLAKWSAVQGIEPNNLFLWTLLGFLSLLLTWACAFCLLLLVRTLLGRIRRRYRWHRAHKYLYWKFRGGINRIFISFYYLVAAAAFYQFTLSDDSVALSVLAGLVLFPCLSGVLALLFYKTWQKGKHHTWLLYKNKRTRLIYGAVYMEYKQAYRGFIAVRMGMAFLQAAAIGLLYDYGQVQIGVLLALQLAYLLALVFKRPFEDSVHGFNHIVYHSLRLACLVVLAILASETQNSGTQLVLAVVALSLHAFNILYITVASARGLWLFLWHKWSCPCAKDKSHKKFVNRFHAEHSDGSKDSAANLGNGLPHWGGNLSLSDLRVAAGKKDNTIQKMISQTSMPDRLSSDLSVVGDMDSAIELRVLERKHNQDELEVPSFSVLADQSGSTSSRQSLASKKGSSNKYEAMMLAEQDGKVAEDEDDDEDEEQDHEFDDDDDGEDEEEVLKRRHSLLVAAAPSARLPPSSFRSDVSDTHEGSVYIKSQPDGDVAEDSGSVVVQSASGSGQAAAQTAAGLPPSLSPSLPALPAAATSAQHARRDESRWREMLDQSQLDQDEVNQVLPALVAMGVPEQGMAWLTQEGLVKGGVPLGLAIDIVSAASRYTTVKTDDPHAEAGSPRPGSFPTQNESGNDVDG